MPIMYRPCKSLVTSPADTSLTPQAPALALHTPATLWTTHHSSHRPTFFSQQAPRLHPSAVTPRSPITDSTELCHSPHWSDHSLHRCLISYTTKSHDPPYRIAYRASTDPLSLLCWPKSFTPWPPVTHATEPHQSPTDSLIINPTESCHPLNTLSFTQHTPQHLTHLAHLTQSSIILWTPSLACRAHHT